MNICKRCLYLSRHPLNITFDDQGVCSGCRVHDEKNSLDWGDRAARLNLILSDYRNRSGKNYDCIVPVSGARDSYYIVHIVKNIYGMNPLLVTYNKHYNTALGVRNLANLRSQFNCDIMTLTLSPNLIKKITRATLRRLGSIYWHCVAGQTTYPVQLAVKLKIPLIIWGAHQGLDQVGMFSHLDEVEMTRKYRKEHDLMGCDAEDLIDEFDGISDVDVSPFVYPDESEVGSVGVRGIYLGNYLRWDSKQQHEDMLQRYSYETALQARTYDTYSDVDCWVYSDLHDYIKYIKHGFGKVVDHACRDIRLGHITRDEGLDLVNRYMYRKPQKMDLFLNWLGVTANSFDYIIDQHRNPLIWSRNDNWEWVNNFDLYQKTAPSSINDAGYILTPHQVSVDSTDEYILIGKGC